MAVGESETIRIGRFVIVTAPFAPRMVTGNSGRSFAASGSAPSANVVASARSAATGMSLDTKTSALSGGGWFGRLSHANRPSSEG